MSVDELSQEQLEELRESYFYQLQDTSGDEVLGDITEPQGIDMAHVKAHYSGIDFVDDDFFCSSE